MPKKFCYSRLGDPCKVSLASYGFTDISNHKKIMGLRFSAFKFLNSSMYYAYLRG